MIPEPNVREPLRAEELVPLSKFSLLDEYLDRTEVEHDPVARLEVAWLAKLVCPDYSPHDKLALTEEEAVGICASLNNLAAQDIKEQIRLAGLAGLNTAIYGRGWLEGVDQDSLLDDMLVVGGAAGLMRRYESQVNVYIATVLLVPRARASITQFVHYDLHAVMDSSSYRERANISDYSLALYAVLFPEQAPQMDVEDLFTRLSSDASFFGRLLLVNRKRLLPLLALRYSRLLPLQF